MGIRSKGERNDLNTCRRTADLDEEQGQISDDEACDADHSNKSTHRESPLRSRTVVSRSSVSWEASISTARRRLGGNGDAIIFLVG